MKKILSDVKSGFKKLLGSKTEAELLSEGTNSKLTRWTQTTCAIFSCLPAFQQLPAGLPDKFAASAKIPAAAGDEVVPV